MKKLIFLLMALPLVLVSCDDDKDFPDVDIYMSFEGGTQVDDVYYVVQGDVLQVTDVNLVNHGEKEASLGGVRYFWDYMPIGTTITRPYAIDIATEDLQVGNHLLQAEMPIYAVGYSICTGYAAKKVVIVETADEIPGGNDSTPDDGTEQAVIQSGSSN